MIGVSLRGGGRCENIRNEKSGNARKWKMKIVDERDYKDVRM